MAYKEITEIDIFLDKILPFEDVPERLRYATGNVSFVTTYGEIIVWVERHEVYDRFFDRGNKEEEWL